MAVSRVQNTKILYLTLYLEYSGKKYEFLPPYSPDYSPIEPAFSTIKGSVQRDGDLMREDMSIRDDYDANVAVITRLHQHVFYITPGQAWGWFHHCGYV
jgi:hypothetical protein